MTIRLVVTCNSPGCLALYLVPADSGRDDPLNVAAPGWTAEGTRHWCPACTRGAGPVYERGDCPVCSGLRRPHPDGDRCAECGHFTADTTDGFDIPEYEENT